MDYLANTNSSKESTKSYLTRLSNIFLAYGIVSFFLGFLFTILPIATVIAVGVYVLILLTVTFFLVVVTLGVGLVLLNDIIISMWSSLSDVNSLLERAQELSQTGTPIILGISIGLLAISLILYLVFEDRRMSGKIAIRSVFITLSAVFLVLFFTDGINLWS